MNGVRHRAGRAVAGSDTALPQPLIALAIVTCVLVAYVPILGCGFIWDDDDYVTHNPTLVGWDGLWRIWVEIGATPQYYPLVFTSFWIEHALWGVDPEGYHATNVVLHAAGALVLWRLLRRLGIPWSGFAAALYALHPVQVESVAWITERKNVLSTLCYLCAALAYLRFERADPIHPNARHRWTWYAVSLALYLAALLSKTVTFSLPAALAVVLWWHTGSWSWRRLTPLVPFVLVAVVPVSITIWLERTHVGASGHDFDLSPAGRWLLAGRALWFYLAKLGVPLRLTFIYPRWTIDPSRVTQWAFPITAGGVLFGLWWLRERLGRGPLAAALYFAGTLVPALGFFDVYPMRYSYVADHFQYLASIGPLVLLSTGVARLASSASRAALSLLVHAAATSGLVVLGLLTFQQCQIYRDPESLWQDTLSKNPECWMAHANLAAFYADAQAWDQTEAHYRESLRLNPRNVEALVGLAALYSNQNQFDRADSYFAQALALDVDLPTTYFYRGLHEGRRGAIAAAADNFHRATELNPRFADAHCYLARAQWSLGQYSDAMDEWRQTLRLNPRHAQANLLLGSALLERDEIDAAIRCLRLAVAEIPDSRTAHQNLATALRRKGLTGEARRHEAEAARLSTP